MARMARVSLALGGAAALSGVACGGKIMDDGQGAPAPVAAAPPLADKPTVADACDAVCQRNARCGAQQSDCSDSCAADLLAPAACAGPATAYIQCYATNLDEGCSVLPPACEAAYCAYARCAGKFLSPYCR